MQGSGVFQVPGDLRNQRKGQQVQPVLSPVMGMQKALYQKEAVDRKSQPSHFPHQSKKLQRPRACIQQHDPAVSQQMQAHMIHDHREKRNAFEHASTQNLVFFRDADRFCLHEALLGRMMSYSITQTAGVQAEIWSRAAGNLISCFLSFLLFCMLPRGFLL